MSMSLADRLARCYASALHDVLRDMGVADCTLPPTIQPLDPAKTLAGEIWTVEGRIDRTRTPHETLLAWTGLLSAAPADRVVICQPNNSEVALMGELSAQALQKKGVRGYIADGGCRDVAFIETLGFPVFCRFFTPADIVARWIPTALGQPIRIGEATIATGDYAIADRDGVVVIPAALAEEAIGRAEQVMSTESEMRAAILGGMDPQAAYLKYGKF